MTITVVCIAGDGIGPEVTAAMKAVVAATGAPIAWDDRPAGLGALATHGDTLPQETVFAIFQHRLAIKGPTNTPKGEGHSSVNVRLRQIFDLHVGYRPYQSLPFPIGGKDGDKIDIQLFRQNTEGFYACNEREILDESGKVQEVILEARFTREAMTRIATYAFRAAKMMGRDRIAVVTKSNILKLSGKLYRDAFMEVAALSPDIEVEELLVDATGMMVSTNPKRLEVIVTENLFGDILSDVIAGRIGGLGVAPGANIGDDRAIFEAVHGSADDIAGQDKANPIALILSAAMMLEHAGRGLDAVLIKEAVDNVIAAGTSVTYDLRKQYPEGIRYCGTKEVTEAICAEVTRLRAI